MNKRKLSVIGGMGILALVAGFGARSASAQPMALPLTRLSSPILDHDGDYWRDRRQSYQQDRFRDQDNHRWDRDDRSHDRDDHRDNRDQDRDRNHSRDDRNRDRDAHRGDRDDRR